MAIDPNNGVLDIINGVLKVTSIDIKQAGGFTTAINTVARNDVLLFDDQKATTTFLPTEGSDYRSSTGFTRDTTALDFNDGWVYWPLQLPNSWHAEFDMLIASTGGVFTFSLFNTSTPNHTDYTANDGGYKIVFDNTLNKISIYFEGSVHELVNANVRSADWQRVIINYFQGAISISLAGEVVLHYEFTENYQEFDSRYVGFSATAGTSHKIRNLRIHNSDKWLYTNTANASHISYMSGNVGVGTLEPSEKLDVHGNVHVSRDVTIDGNLTVSGSTFSIDTTNLSVEDPIIELARGNASDTIDSGIIMTRGGSNVAMTYMGDESELVLAYTQSGATDSEITPDADGGLDVRVYGNLFANNLTTVANVEAVYLKGDGSELTQITLDQVVGYSNITANTIQLTNSDVGLKLTGNVEANYFVGDGSQLDNISATLQEITDNGNTTSNVVQFTNDTTAFIAESNVGIGTSLPAANLHVVGYQYVNDPPTVSASFDHTDAPLTLTHLTPTSDTAIDDPKPVLHLTREGTQGTNYGARASLKMSRYEHDSTASRSRLDVTLADGTYSETSVMTVRSDGRVGINTTAPIQQLDVVGNVHVSNNITTNSLTLNNVSVTTTFGLDEILNVSNTTTNTIQITNTSGTALDVTGGASVGSNLQVGTANLFVDTTTGRVGVGTNAPLATLDVHGTANVGTLSVTNILGTEIAIGTNAGETAQGTSAVAVGRSAGQTAQGVNAVAVGYNAGNTSQGLSAIAIGLNAGLTDQGDYCVALSRDAGLTSQSNYAVAIGLNAGEISQGDSSVAVGYNTGATSQGNYCVAVGRDSGLNNQGENAIAIGRNAGESNQGTNAIGIGFNAGLTSQGVNTVAVGIDAGEISQNNYAVALGDRAGQTSQDNSATAVGVQAGNTSQGSNTVAVGRLAAQSNQGVAAVAVGNAAGQVSQNNHAVAIGNGAGLSAQSSFSVAMGYLAGQNAQDHNSVAIGPDAGRESQGRYSTTVGRQAGMSNQGNDCVAVGHQAGFSNQGYRSVAIGRSAGFYGAGSYSTFIGPYAGHKDVTPFDVGVGYRALYNNSTGTGGAVAVGTYALNEGSCDFTVGIGYYAGKDTAHNNCVMLNASGAALASGANSRFYVKPIRLNSGSLSWSSSSGEVYANTSDDRVKHNETYIKNALRTIMKLKPQTYDKSPDLESNTYIEMRESGLMVQDIWYDVPEMRHIVRLSQTADPTPEKPPAPSDDPADDPDYSAWGIAPSSLEYDQVIPFLAKAIQEVVAEVPRSKTSVSNTWGQDITGLVVSADTNELKTNVTPLVSLSTTSMDRKWYGVVSNEKTDSTDYDVLIDTKGDTQIWVTDVNGPLESGDLVTTSNVAQGFAQKQNDDIVRNYTIAKVTQDCDFTEPTQHAIKVPKKELVDVTYYIRQDKVPIDKSEYDFIGMERNKTSEYITKYRLKNGEEDDTISQKRYDLLDASKQEEYEPFQHLQYYRLDNYETKVARESHPMTEVRQELVEVLDENGQTVWEETGETRPVYTLVDRGTYKAALVTCKLF